GAGVCAVCAHHAEAQVAGRLVGGAEMGLRMAGRTDLRGKRVRGFGLEPTGLATALFCAARGPIETPTDTKPAEELRETAERLREAGVRLELGSNAASVLHGQELVIASPGVPADVPLLEQARALGLPLWSEIELADRFLRGQLIAITGSNGKT